MIALTATQSCEGFLHKEREYYIEHKILPSKVAIIERMLNRSSELEDCYAELVRKLPERGWQRVLDVLIHTAFAGTPEKLSRARKGKNQLAQLNQDIKQKAYQLANLIRERTEVAEQSLFYSDHENHIVDFINLAATDLVQFKWHVKDKLDLLHSQFLGDQYWPLLPDIIEAIGDNASEAEIYPHDNPTEAGTRSSRPSKRDFFRALIVNIEEAKKEFDQRIPTDFHLSDRSIADAGNVCLNLSSDELASPDDIKNIRHKDK